MRHRVFLKPAVIATAAGLSLLLATELAAAAPANAEFAAMDTNHDGKVSPPEHAVGARKLFDAMDSVRNGRVTASEMDATQPAASTARVDPKAMTSAGKIGVIDRDADGALSAEEHAAGAREMFASMDTNADGFLSPEEMRLGHARMREHVAR